MIQYGTYASSLISLVVSIRLNVFDQNASGVKIHIYEM